MTAETPAGENKVGSIIKEVGVIIDVIWEKDTSEGHRISWEKGSDEIMVTKQLNGEFVASYPINTDNSSE